MQRRSQTTYGFARTSKLLEKQIRGAGESRGFAVTRLLTHWEDIVGPETARIARPVTVSYGRQGIGATLTILTTGAQAPMLQADLPRIQERVNACYGYNAISRIRITQTAATGFSEGRAVFAAQTNEEEKPNPALREKAVNTTSTVADGDLRTALARLGENILNKMQTKDSVS